MTTYWIPPPQIGGIGSSDVIALIETSKYYGSNINIRGGFRIFWRGS